MANSIRLRIVFLATLLGLARAPRLGAQQSPWATFDTARLLLPPRAYAKLPNDVRADLVLRGCRIPQATGPDVAASFKSHPNNVLSGAFTARGSHDWAVLCSIRDSSRILVYHDGAAQRVDSLHPTADNVYLGREGDVPVFDRVLMRATPAEIRRLAAAWGDPAPPALDHLGIEDYFAGKASVIYYFRRGRWQEFQGMN